MHCEGGDVRVSLKANEEEAEVKAKEEKAKAAEQMAEAVWKQHEITVVVAAEQKQKLKELATCQCWVSEKREEGSLL
jgi:hypothetical protein